MIDRKTFYQTISDASDIDASFMPLTELTANVESVSDLMHSPMLKEAVYRLRNARYALSCLEDALFYVRMYQSSDSTGEGEKRRQRLIDDSETFIRYVRDGGIRK